jgi:hypothetical protein
VLEKLIDGLLWILGVVRNRPKLAIEYAPLDGLSTAGPPGKLTVRWRYRLTITNLSKEDALELAVIRTSNPQLETLGVHHIKGLEHLEVERQLAKELDKDAVVAARYDFHGALEPPELKDLTLVLRYRSSSGVTCYTDYLRNRRAKPNTWPFREPKRASVLPAMR